MTLDPPIYRSHHDPAELTALKKQRGLTVSVCLPALNEEATIGQICTQITSLMPDVVDELIVVDSGSTDGTLELAKAAGAVTFSTSSILPEIPIEAGGKGEALWKSLAVAGGDVVVWLDSDTRNFSTSFVLDLIEPLLVDSRVGLSKAFYDRPLRDADGALTTGGARVTELLVRPLAHLLFPELLGFIQPLAGECAGDRRLLRSLPFFTGYGVEIGLLIDLAQRVGLERVVQVDLGSRIHRNQEILPLGRMAFQVARTMTTRAEQLDRVKFGNEWPELMSQFRSSVDGPLAEQHLLRVDELPPMETVSAAG